MLPSRLRVLLALLLAVGCSWTFVTPTPENPRDAAAATECTESKAAPIADSVLAALMATATVIVLVLLVDNVVTDSKEGTGGLLIVDGLAAGVTVAYTFSALYGFDHTDRCQKSRRRH